MLNRNYCKDFVKYLMLVGINIFYNLQSLIVELTIILQKAQYSQDRR